MARPPKVREEGEEGLQATSASLYMWERQFLAKFGKGILTSQKLMAIIIKGIGVDAFNILSGNSHPEPNRRKDDEQSDT